MKIKILPLTLLALGTWSLLFSFAAADWDTGACPGTGSAPCIETVINGNTYYFNGTGLHADVWHGRPAAEGGGDFVFEGDDVDLECALNLSCSVALSGQIKKCQDSSGEWRIGVQVNSATLSDGTFCGSINVSGFPWYSKDPTITGHCPFEDDCDSFIPYDPDATSYAGNFGPVSVAALGAALVDGEHIHDVVFTPGVGANISFASDLYDCNESQDCSMNGVLTITNATSFDIH
ncbi:hypothetical protein [Marinobacter alexandrii]